MPRHDPQHQLGIDVLGPTHPTDRLFFAIFPDPATAERIAAFARSLRDELALRGRPLRADRLHVTLHHLGDHVGLPPGLVDSAEQAAAGIATPSFEASFDSVSSFTGRQGNRPLVLRGVRSLAPLIAMQSLLGQRMNLAGLAKWTEKAFVPHVTLLYDERGVVERPIDAIAWMVREFVLVHSLLGRTEHRILGRWPLRG